MTIKTVDSKIKTRAEKENYLIAMFISQPFYFNTKKKTQQQVAHNIDVHSVTASTPGHPSLLPEMVLPSFA